METLSNYQKAVSEYSSIEASVKSMFGSAYNGIETNWDYVSEQMNMLKDILSNEYSFEPLEKYSNFLSDSKAFIEYSNQIANILNESNVQNFDYIFDNFDKQIVDFQSITLDDAQSKLNDCLSTFNQLRQWCGFRELLNKIKKFGMLKFCLLYTSDAADDTR